MYDFSTLKPRLDIGAEKWKALAASGVKDPMVAPLSIADMEFVAPPEITGALRRAADFGVFGYTMADGGYKAAVCDWMARRHGWSIRPEWIVNTFGVTHAILQAVHTFTKKGERVIIQPPIYPPFRSCVEKAGRRVAENPLRLTGRGYEMDYEGLEALASAPDVKMLLLCSPHNPVGRVWKQEELRRVSEICRKNGVLVFSDEIHFDFIHPPYAHTVFAALDEKTAQNCIVGTSASKSFNLAGLATANIIIPNGKLRKEFQDKTEGYTGEYNSYFGLCATRAAYEKAEGWLDELLPVIRKNAQITRGFLAERFPSVRVFPLEGTYLLWADFNSLGLSPKELKRFMTEEARLWLGDGIIYGKEGAGFERINLALPTVYLEAALDRLEKAAERRGLPR